MCFKLLPSTDPEEWVSATCRVVGVNWWTLWSSRIPCVCETVEGGRLYLKLPCGHSSSIVFHRDAKCFYQVSYHTNDATYELLIAQSNVSRFYLSLVVRGACVSALWCLHHPWKKHSSLSSPSFWLIYPEAKEICYRNNLCPGIRMDRYEVHEIWWCVRKGSVVAKWICKETWTVFIYQTEYLI